MCRTLVEIQYQICNHTVIWEIPSPIRDCSGILHRLTLDQYQICKHCWVARGHQKKSWRRNLVLIPAYRRREILKLYIPTMTYSIQAVDAKRPRKCPTWHRRYPWQTRKAAIRTMKLRSIDLHEEYRHIQAGYTMTRTPNPHHPFDFAPHYHIDEDAQQSALMEVVAPRKAFPRGGRCPLCWGWFVHRDPAKRHRAGPGGLRKLPCSYGHTFCIGCIRRYFLLLRDQRIQNIQQGQRGPVYSCPSCREEFTIFIHRPTSMVYRVSRFFQYYFERMQMSYHPVGPDYPMNPARIGSVQEWAGYLATITFGLPMFFAVEHSMGIFQSKSGPGGKLPFVQLAVVGLTGLVLTAVWVHALLLSPLIALAYYIYHKYLVRIPDMLLDVPWIRGTALWFLYVHESVE